MYPLRIHKTPLFSPVEEEEDSIEGSATLPCIEERLDQEVAEGSPINGQFLCLLPKEPPPAPPTAKLQLEAEAEPLAGAELLARAELLTEGPLPTKEHLREFSAIAHSFNYPPDATVPKPNYAHLQMVKTSLTNAVIAALQKAPRHLVLGALDFAIPYTGLKKRKPEYGVGPQPALSYFLQAFDGKLTKLLRAEHAARVEAKKLEAIAEIEVREAADKAEARVNGTKTRQAFIRAGAAPFAGSRTITIDGKRRYHPGAKLVPLIGLFGEHTNKLFHDLEAKGATFEDIDDAFGKENGKSGDRTLTRDEVLKSVRRSVDCALSERRDADLKAKFGEPDKLCGGTPHPSLKREWICISREKVSEILAQCPDVKLIDGAWRGCHYGGNWNCERLVSDKFREIVDGYKFSHDDYGTGMQARVEAELLQAMLAEQRYGAEQRQWRERKETGIEARIGGLK